MTGGDAGSLASGSDTEVDADVPAAFVPDRSSLFANAAETSASTSEAKGVNSTTGGLSIDGVDTGSGGESGVILGGKTGGGSEGGITGAGGGSVIGGGVTTGGGTKAGVDTGSTSTGVTTATDSGGGSGVILGGKTGDGSEGGITGAGGGSVIGGGVTTGGGTKAGVDTGSDSTGVTFDERLSAFIMATPAPCQRTKTGR
jgi:hypothetical protein